MKNLLCMMIVALLVFLPMMVAVAENAVLTETETVTEDDAWDEPIDIEYEDDGTEDTEEEDMVEKEANPFVGEWLCDNASIYIDEEDGVFDVFIMWDTSDTEQDIWEYTCTLDAETGVLTGEGKKSHETIGDEGEVVSSEEIYADGAATFILEDNILIWDDANENVAQGMRFERGAEDEKLIDVEMEEEVDKVLPMSRTILIKQGEAEDKA